MLKLLIKKQMLEIFRLYFYDSKKNKARSKAGIIAYIILFVLIMIGVLGGIFTTLSVFLCEPLAAVEMEWLYFAIIGLIAILLGAFGSVFNTFSCLYLPKDNDLLLSMPIPNNVLIASRILTVYLLGFMYSGVVIIPAVVVYWIVGGLSLATVLGGLWITLLISIFVLTLSCFLGFAVARISLRLKNKSFITVVISLLFIGGYYFFYFKAQLLIQDLLANAVVYGEAIKGKAYFLYMFGRAAVGDAMATLVVTIAIAGLFGLVWVLLSRSFIKIATSSGRIERRVYKGKAMKQGNVFGALLAKELKRFGSSSLYMLNCGLGTLLLPVIGILILVKGNMMLAAISEMGSEVAGLGSVLMCTAICAIAGMNDIAVPSISLEGKSFWILQSLPITYVQVLKVKLCTHLILTMPSAGFCLLCIFIAGLSQGIQMLLLTLVVLIFVLFVSLLDLALGVIGANMTWVNEVTPIKQNVAVFLALMLGIIYSVLLCGGFMLLRPEFTIYMTIFASVTLCLCAVLWLWLKAKGSKRLAGL